MRSACLVPLAFAAALSGPAAARECAPPEVKIVQDEPTGATLSWPRGDGAVEYFLQYSTGKFPTQIRLDLKPDETTLTAELTNLRPGETTTVAFCEGYAAGACPGHTREQACNTLVEVTAALARPGVAQPDLDQAVCTLRPDVAWIGHLADEAENRSVMPADSAESCCQQCAWMQSNLPYAALCTHFIFDPSAGQCHAYGEVQASAAAPGAVSGEVVAWPRPRR